MDEYSCTHPVDDASLLDIIRAAEGPVSLGELLEATDGVTRRTLQRRLRSLVDAGRLVPSGQARARRYRLGTSASGADRPAGPGTPDGFPSNQVREDTFPYDELSPEAAEVRRLIARPVTERASVGYRRELLDDYTPNRSCYLSASLRGQLYRTGDSGGRTRPAGTYGRAVLGRLLIDLSWASSRLEGNTYSYLDTRRLIEEGRAADGKQFAETQMILNHKAGIEFLLENIDEVGFDRYTLLNLHALLSENLLPNPADEGRLRRHPVAIGYSVFRPLSLPQGIEDAFDVVLDKAGRIEDPFEQSFFVLVHLPYLQPFADVNKRVSRLLANLPLLRANFCPLTFVGVPNEAYVPAVLGVYELGRVELLRDVFTLAYERSARIYPDLRHDYAQPDPLRLRWREVVRRAVRDVVTTPTADAERAIGRVLDDAGVVDLEDREAVHRLVTDELDRLHDGVLARYGLRPSQLERYLAGVKDEIDRPSKDRTTWKPGHAPSAVESDRPA